MTTNHEHTPSTEHVRFIYSLDGADREYKAQEFDRWHAAEIAAAEQRGKAEAWNEAADFIGKEFDFEGMAIDLKEENPYRADQMEADQ